MVYLNFCPEIHDISNDDLFFRISDKECFSNECCLFIEDVRFLKSMKVSLRLIARFVILRDIIVRVGIIDLKVQKLFNLPFLHPH